MRTDPADAEAIELSLEIAAERGGDLTPAPDWRRQDA